MIISKLQNMIMIELEIDPSDQKIGNKIKYFNVIEPIEYFFEWCDIIPNEYLVKIIDKHFFPKWLNTLHMWLRQDPNYEEITIWQFLKLFNLIKLGIKDGRV